MHITPLTMLLVASVATLAGAQAPAAPKTPADSVVADSVKPKKTGRFGGLMNKAEAVASNKNVQQAVKAAGSDAVKGAAVGVACTVVPGAAVASAVTGQGLCANSGIMGLMSGKGVGGAAATIAGGAASAAASGAAAKAIGKGGLTGAAARGALGAIGGAGGMSNAAATAAAMKMMKGGGGTGISDAAAAAAAMKMMPNAGAMPSITGMPGASAASAVKAVAGAKAAAPMARDAASALRGKFKRGGESKESMVRDLSAGRLQLRDISFEGTADAPKDGFEESIALLVEALQGVEGRYLVHVPAESDGKSPPDLKLAERRASQIALHLQIAGIPSSRLSVASAASGTIGNDAPVKPGEARVQIVRVLEKPKR